MSAPPPPSHDPQLPVDPVKRRAAFARAATMMRGLTDLLVSAEFSEMFYTERRALDAGHPALRAVALEVIQADRARHPIDEAKVPVVVHLLSVAIHEEACAIREQAELTWSEDAPPIDRWLEASAAAGMLFFDAVLVARLALLGEQGGRYAESVQAKSRAAWASSLIEGPLPGEGAPDLWRLWLPTLGNLFSLVGDALWKSGLRERALREANNPPGLVVPVMVGLTRLHARNLAREEENGNTLLRSGNIEVAQIRRVEPILLPAFELKVLEAMLDRGLNLLGSVTAHRMLRWEVTEGHRRVMQHDPDARALRIEGGWSALASDKLKLHGRKAAEEVHAIVTAQAHCAFLLPSGAYGNLLSYSVVPARGQRPGEVTLILGDALLPHYVFELRRRMSDASRSAREAQRLVPMVDLPPFVGRLNEHGQQATLSLAVVTEMRIHARQLIEQGGVLIDPTHFMLLALQAGLPPRVLPALLDRWQRDGDDAPAFLQRVERDRYTLGPAHGAARTFLEEAGRREREASTSGQQSTKLRANARFRKPPR